VKLPSRPAREEQTQVDQKTEFAVTDRPALWNRTTSENPQRPHDKCRATPLCHRTPSPCRNPAGSGSPWTLAPPPGAYTPLCGGLSESVAILPMPIWL
jgi:hypothetical protein